MTNVVSHAAQAPLVHAGHTLQLLPQLMGTNGHMVLWTHELDHRQ